MDNMSWNGRFTPFNDKLGYSNPMFTREISPSDRRLWPARREHIISDEDRAARAALAMIRRESASHNVNKILNRLAARAIGKAKTSKPNFGLAEVKSDKYHRLADSGYIVPAKGQQMPY